MSSSRQDRIKSLEEKKKQLEARIQKLKAQESAKKRKEDTRRKILLGALVQHLILTGYWSESEIHKQLDKFLTKSIDRKLFGLAVDSNKSQARD
ncbi:MAG: mobilization protein [Prochloraceae cyanobacterium]|nr:mobilization protein [Prochloraceae cyanobacterium]